MDIQNDLRKASALTHEIGRKILEAAEKEDISALRSLSNQLREVMDILNIICLVDKMARAAKNN